MWFRHTTRSNHEASKEIPAVHELVLHVQFLRVVTHEPLLSVSSLVWYSYVLPVLVTHLVCDPVFNLCAVVTNTLQLKEREKKKKS